CIKYLKLGVQLSNKIFALIYFTANLLPRGSEITAIRVCNTEQVIQNVFILYRRLIIVFKYNKSRVVNNHYFYVIRYLPLTLSITMY
ncbi:hypothetical protein BKA64DRAFT_570850, partial [Cadophora sp. MPI-SDFR-AT-0126]